MSLRSRLTALGLLAAAGVTWVALPGDVGIKEGATWQRMASPGALSEGHAHLEDDCASCHVPYRGAARVQCVLCHANDEPLLQRQPTSFHADVSSCRECHPEHRGLGPTPTVMDHGALARLGLDGLERSSDGAAADLRAWLALADGRARTARHPAGPDAPSTIEQVLDCHTCHEREDRHAGLMGADCVTCHTTTTWTLERFRHPSPGSKDCVQCHQAPPSHYMGHFHMVSAKVARRPHADVTECFECHRTTAWTDIPGVGRYKHH